MNETGWVDLIFLNSLIESNYRIQIYHERTSVLNNSLDQQINHLFLEFHYNRNLNIILPFLPPYRVFNSFTRCASLHFSFTFMDATQGFAQCSVDCALCNELQWVLPQLSTLSAVRETKRKERERGGGGGSLRVHSWKTNFIYRCALFVSPATPTVAIKPPPLPPYTLPPAVSPLVCPAALDLYWINAKGVLIDRPWRPEAAEKNEREWESERSKKYFCTFLWPTTMLSCKWPSEWTAGTDWRAKPSRAQNGTEQNAALCQIPRVAEAAHAL